MSPSSDVRAVAAPGVFGPGAVRLDVGLDASGNEGPPGIFERAHDAVRLEHDLTQPVDLLPDPPADDTVGVDEMEAPFSAEVRDGRMYGRGAYDMKCGLAACLAAAFPTRRRR